MFKLQQKFQFTNMTLSKRSMSHILKTGLQLENQTPIFCAMVLSFDTMIVYGVKIKQKF